MFRTIYTYYFQGAFISFYTSYFQDMFHVFYTCYFQLVSWLFQYLLPQKIESDFIFCAITVLQSVVFDFLNVLPRSLTLSNCLTNVMFVRTDWKLSSMVWNLQTMKQLEKRRLIVWPTSSFQLPTNGSMFTLCSNDVFPEVPHHYLAFRWSGTSHFLPQDWSSCISQYYFWH